MNEKENEMIVNDKISVSEYLDNNELLQLTYLPFDTKLEIVGHLITGIANSLGGLNTSLLRRISTEVFIESLTNIDMNIQDDNGLKGFDTLYFTNELNNLKDAIGPQYIEFETILSERVSDYLRTETNPALTINAIYDQIKQYFNTVMDYLNEKIQNVDVDALVSNIAQNIALNTEENDK